MQLALAIDLERCTGCQSCEAACKLENRLGSDVARSRVLRFQFQEPPALEMVLAVCQQCERPACVRACGSTPKALRKDPGDGVVKLDSGCCTGCQECVKACPYSAISFDFRSQRPEKCDLCSGRREHGLPPACVSVCPGRALSLGTVDGLLERAESEGRRRRSLDRFAQGPSLVYLERMVGRDGQEGREVQLPSSPFHPSPPYVPKVARQGRGVDHGRRGIVGRLLGRLPRPAGSLEAFPYSGAARVWEADRVEAGGCNLCFNACTARFHLKNGRVIGVTGNPDDPVLQGRVCAKVQMQLQQFYSPHRLTHPMKRVGPRGEGRFRRIGWDEALDEVAERLREVRARYGPESLGIYTGTRTGMLTLAAAAPIFAGMFGTPNQQGTAPFCGTAADAAYHVVQGVRGNSNSYTPADIGSAQLYLFVGDNMAETRPVFFGAVNEWRLKNGTRMVVVDPRLSVTAGKADEWLPIRPGTDMALALAMMHYIISHDLVDSRFVEKWVEGYPEVRRFILEREYGARWAERITDIPAATIERLAREYATTDRAVIFLNRGIMQHSNAVQTMRAFLMLCAITGHYGRKGAGCVNINSGLPFWSQAPRERRAPIARPAIRKSPAAWMEAMESGQPYPIKALLMSTNPFVFWPNQARLRRAIEKVDLMVHMELWPNETTAWADYVFPAASSIEMGEIDRACEDRRVVWIPKLIDPPGEARPDTHFWIDLGKRFGFDDVLKEEYKDSEKFWDNLMLADPRMKGMTVARLRRNPHGWARGPLPTEDSEELETLFEEGVAYPADPQGRRFPTTSGRLELWTPELEDMFNAVGLTALPEFYGEPGAAPLVPYPERLTTDADEGVPSPFWSRTNADVVRVVSRQESGAGGFDTELITGRASAAHYHSWTHFWWQPHEMWPDLYVQIHPEKAGVLGIGDGDLVVIESSRGSVEAVAWVYTGIRKNSVYIPIGWGEWQPYNPWRGPNWLISKDERDPVSDQTNMKAGLCRVRKAGASDRPSKRSRMRLE